MKTKSYLFVIFCFSVLLVRGQKNVPPFTVENISVTPPVFTGIENSAKMTTGGQDAYLREYLNKNVEFREVAEQSYAEGTAVVQFVVTTSGKVTDFKIVNSVSPSIDNELIRVLKTTSGMWKPGYQNNVPADMEKEIAMMFVTANGNQDNPEKYFVRVAISNFLKGNEMFLLKNKAKKALKYYNNSIKYLPNETASLIVRGLCKYKLGDEQGALTDWKRINAIGKYDMNVFVESLRAQKGFAYMMKTLEQNNTVD